MLKMDVNATFNGSSTDEEVIIATFSANYSGDKNVYVSMNIEDIAAYETKKTVVDKDFSDFTAKVIESIKELQQ